MTSAYSIDVSLAEDPNLHARAWRRKVKELCSKAARAVFPQGLNSFDVMLTASEYATKHPTSPKRKTPKMPKPFSGTASKQAMHIYDEKKARYHAYVEAYDGPLSQASVPTSARPLSNQKTGLRGLR